MTKTRKPRLHTLKFTDDELDAISTALDSANGDEYDLEAVYGEEWKRLSKAADSASKKVSRIIYQDHTP